MSSDFTITVTPGMVEAIQGNAVSSESLTSVEDGYVLTWDNADGYWVARPVTSSYTGLRQVYFTSNGNWNCPIGVTNILVVAAGGGGGGGGATGVSGNYGSGGGGGGGAIQQISCISVTPGNNYTVTIGAGGSGGAASSDGSDGNSTTFSSLFTARGGGRGFTNASAGWNLAGAMNGITLSIYIYASGYGGSGSSGPGSGISGSGNGLYSGGSGGIKSSVANYPAGGGGGAGPQGVGANGGNGTDSGTGGNGLSASSNTGAGGGGGGQGGGSGTNGTGGIGGSGYLYVIY